MSVIYRLTDSKNRFYIGSTTNLKRRLKQHRSSRNNCYSKKLCDDWTSDILEHTEKVGDDLLWLERKYFDAHYGCPLFVNKNRPIATEEEIQQYYQQNTDNIKEHQQQYYEQNKDKIKERHQQYYEQNKDKIKERHQQYYEQNKDKIKEYFEQNKDKMKEYQQQYREQNADKIKERHQQYYEQNADKLKEYQQQYYEQNKDKIKGYNSEKIKCECGVVIRRDYKSQHLKTKKHLNFINNLNSESSFNVPH